MTVKAYFRALHLPEFSRSMSVVGRRIWLYVLGVCGHCAAYSISQVAIAHSNRFLVDAAIEANMRLLGLAAGLRTIALLMMALLYPVLLNVVGRSLKRTLANLRVRFMAHLVRLPRRYFDAHHTGETTSLFTNDLEQFEALFTRGLPAVTDALVWGATAGVALAVLDWRLALLVLALGVLSAVLMASFAHPLRKTADAIQAALSGLTQLTGDLLSGIRVIKVFDLDQAMERRFAGENSALTQNAIRRARLSAGMASAGDLLAKLNLLGVLAVGAFMVASGAVDVGTVVAVVSLQRGIAYMFTRLGGFFSGLQGSLAAGRRIFDVLDIPEEPLADAPSSGVSATGALVLKNVTFAYEGRHAVLRGISLSIAHGQTVAIVGESGAGKTTLFRLLLGLYRPDAGQIVIGGKSILESSLSEIRGATAYVPQNAYLFGETVEENIRIGRPGADSLEVIAAARAANAHGFITDLPQGYGTRVQEGSTALSGGQRQRVAIARALLKNAPILLFDEATSALDSESENLIRGAILSQLSERTIVTIAHRLWIVRQADTILVMDEGRIAERGTHRELLSRSGRYRRLCGSILDA